MRKLHPAPLWVVLSQLTSLQVMCPGCQRLWRLDLKGTTGTQSELGLWKHRLSRRCR